jgi:hypothetical protein
MRECKGCGEQFKPKRKEQKYCSHACSVAYNRKHNYDFGHIL